MIPLLKHKGAVQMPKYVWTFDRDVYNWCHYAENPGIWYKSTAYLTSTASSSPVKEFTHHGKRVYLYEIAPSTSGTNTTTYVAVINAMDPIELNRYIASVYVMAPEDTRYVIFGPTNYVPYCGKFDLVDGVFVDAISGYGDRVADVSGSELIDASIGLYRIWYRYPEGTSPLDDFIVGISTQGGVANLNDDYDGTEKLWVGGFQVELVDADVTEPSPFVTTGEGLDAEARARKRSSSSFASADPVTNYYVSKVQDWAYGAADVDPYPTKFFENEHGQLIGLTRLNDQNDALPHFYDIFRNVATIPSPNVQLEWSIYFLPGNDDQLAIKVQNWNGSGDAPVGNGFTTFFTAATESWNTAGTADEIGYETLETVHGTVYRLWCRFTIGTDLDGQVVHRMATGGSFTANGDHEIYLGGAQVVVLNSVADQLPPVVETTNTTTPNSKVFGSNVLYANKGAVQPTKLLDAYGYDIDFGTELTYDLVQDLVR